MSNKHNSIKFAKMQGCRVPELYWRGRDVATLDMAQLPQHYVIRPTIGYSSKMVFLMDGDLNMMDKQTYSRSAIKEELTKALAENPLLEFLIEEFVRTEQGEYRIPDDYKFYMFNGEIACIQVINRLSPKKGYTTCYDENWNQVQNINTYYPEGASQPKPACFEEMKDHARKLSKTYGIFARIDFYATDKGAVFGEFTPTPFMGHCFTPAGEQMLVEYWDRFCKGMI
ncbi:ATP-grasp fold amidoligase family protein [Pontibacter chitinilyticus]|uniref:ATP-grasp fold amidoligase family protein n=1 Tax=Pontibacter chitinilyticus TaxID=2674989 RepID=UPI00321C0A34